MGKKQTCLKKNYTTFVGGASGEHLKQHNDNAFAHDGIASDPANNTGTMCVSLMETYKNRMCILLMEIITTIMVLLIMAILMVNRRFVCFCSHLA